MTGTILRAPRSQRHRALWLMSVTTEETAFCGTAMGDQYRTYLQYDADKKTYDDAKTAYDNYNQYKRENPGTDIEGGAITEPRARVYLELSEDLAADAEPDVVVVGGAVFDLAGNTNEAEVTTRGGGWTGSRRA